MTATALITGASSGLGAAFARALAARGHALVLAGKAEEHLRRLASELGADAMVADLAVAGDLARLEARVSETAALELLINNAGAATVGPFVGLDGAEHAALIRAHVEAAVRLTRAALPGMLARRHGAVINVASLAAFVPMPGAATYSAGKAYLVAFAEALDAELWGTGVRVQALCPSFTYAELHDRLPKRETARYPKAQWVPVEAVVAESLAALARRGAVCIPGARNRLIARAARNGLLDRVLRALPTSD